MEETKKTWHCLVCGHKNPSGNFCAKCGTPKQNDLTPHSSFMTHDALIATSNKSQTNNNTKRLLAVIIVAVAAYLGYSYYIEHCYDSYEKKLVNVVEEIGNTISNIKNLPGDPNANETKKIAETIDKEVAQLDELKKEFSGTTTPDNKKSQRETILDFIDKNKEVLSKANNILKNQSFWVLRLDKSVEETLTKSVNDFKEAKKNAINVKDVIVHSVNLTERLSLDALEKNLSQYMEKKLQKDNTAYTTKRKEYEERLHKDNQILRQKEELVFLPSEVVTYGKDIVVRGKFYNGTVDRIIGLQEMMIDLVIKKQDEVLLSMENYSIRDNSLLNIFIPPKSYARQTTELRLPGKAEGLGFFDNFVFHAHDIHWKARKAP